MAASLRSDVLGSYRYVLRSLKLTFAGDREAISKGKTAAINEYRKHKAVKDAAAIKKMIDDARDAADFLRSSIVQAKLNDQGRYEMKLQSPDNKPKHINVEHATTAAAGKAHDTEGQCCGGGHGHSHSH